MNETHVVVMLLCSSAHIPLVLTRERDDFDQWISIQEELASRRYTLYKSFRMSAIDHRETCSRTMTW
jgi:hypothetical protein